jgi:hypothetical protein
MDRKAFIRLVWFAVIATGVSCASPPPPPHSEAGGALPLSSEPHLDGFDCPAGNCEHWYQIEVPRKGTLGLSFESFEREKEDKKWWHFSKSEPNPDPPNLKITLMDVKGNSLADSTSDGATEGELGSRVNAGVYMVWVRTQEPGRPFNYRMTSEFKAAAPKPRKPRFKARPAAILEAEGWGVDVEALLIDLGSRDGMRKGLVGRLIENGEEIGKIEIKQVYPDGSRVRVEGGLSRPLGPDTQAEILVPIP